MNLFLQIFPSGGSTLQIDQMHDRVFDKYGNPYLDRSVTWPDKIKRLESIRDAIKMMESCHTYHSLAKWQAKYYDNYLQAYQALGGTKEDFDKCMDVQMKHLTQRSRIVHNIETDSDGYSYHGLSETDEICFFEYL